MFSCTGVSRAAQPFFAVLLQKIFLHRPIVVIVEDLKTQESFQQDIETWLQVESKVQSPKSKVEEVPPSPLFYSAWEVFPHEDKLPHADTISDRLQTLVALTDNSKLKTQNLKLVVTSVTALLQKTFPRGEIQKRTRVLQRGDKINPLDLIEWLEEQGYEPEAQVTQKGEIALRGGILDVWPLISPWPVRLEFFGDELESLRHFDPLTQISREEIIVITIPPAGELGLLKSKVQLASPKQSESGSPKSKVSEMATLLDYLPPETIFLLCEPEQLAVHADNYESQIPPADPFLISWEELQIEAVKKGMTLLRIEENPVGRDGTRPGEAQVLPSHELETATRNPSQQDLQFASLDVYRPLAEHAPELQIAEAQRREFFNQLHRWLRQDYAVHIFCNNDGEQQRFEEIWKELDFDKVGSARCADRTPQRGAPTAHLGSLARGFLCDEARLVVVTDAEIFGRYKIQRPRRLKSPHALVTRSALDIDFTELEEGDLVVHIQYGIGKFLGLKNLPTSDGAREQELSTFNFQLSTGTPRDIT